MDTMALKMLIYAAVTFALSGSSTMGFIVHRDGSENDTGSDTQNVAITQQSEPNNRVGRSTRCHHWSQWYNDNTPSKTVKTDQEHKYRSELESFCPSSRGANVTRFRCKDQKKEPFVGTRTFTEYNATCADMSVGLACVPNPGYMCPDFALQFCCQYPPIVTATTTTHNDRFVVDLPIECNNWTPWINNHRPNDSVSGIDKETFTRADLEHYCPLHRGANISNIRCKDDKGEPFHGFKNTSDFNVSCEQTHYTCTPHPGKTCSDIQIRFYCDCPVHLAPETTTHIDQLVSGVVDLPSECNNWTPWVNNHHPNDSSIGIDKETFTRADLEHYCPLHRGANISKHMCRDEKGEPFYSSRNTSDYHVSCGQTHYTCTPHPGRKCLDMQIRFYCECPAHLSPETIAPTVGKPVPQHTYTTGVNSTTQGSPPSTQTHSLSTSSNIGSSSIPPSTNTDTSTLLVTKGHTPVIKLEHSIAANPVAKDKTTSNTYASIAPVTKGPTTTLTKPEHGYVTSAVRDITSTKATVDTSPATKRTTLTRTLGFSAVSSAAVRDITTTKATVVTSPAAKSTMPTQKFGFDAETSAAVRDITTTKASVDTSPATKSTTPTRKLGFSAVTSAAVRDITTTKATVVTSPVAKCTTPTQKLGFGADTSAAVRDITTTKASEVTSPATKRTTPYQTLSSATSTAAKDKTTKGGDGKAVAKIKDCISCALGKRLSLSIALDIE